VYDERGVPAEGVQVTLLGTTVGTPTDEEGAFKLTGTGLDGAHWLTFAKAGYMTAEVGYNLEDGGELDLSVYLVEEEAVPGSLVGTVSSFTDEPIARALVLMERGDGLTLSSLTASDGTFVFPEVPSTTLRYSVSVEAPGYTTHVTDALISPGSVARLDVTMAPESPMELVRGTVTDGRGLPLPGVHVALEGSHSEWTTDNEGRFSALLDGRMGTRAVRLTLEGYENALVAVPIPDPGLADVELTMQLVPGGGDETLWVRVVNAWTGGPVAGAAVSIEGSALSRVTDEEGVAVLTGHDLEGEVTVTAEKASHTLASEPFVLEDGGTGAVTLNITRVSNAVVLEGTVLDAAEGTPVADASVLVDSGGIVRLTMTDLDGRFTFHNLPPGVSTLVRVTAGGYSDGLVETSLDEYTTNSITMTLRALSPVTAWLDGTVRDAAGPLDGARVTVWNEAGLLEVATSDAAGRFQLHDLPVEPPELWYRVEHAGHDPVEARLHLSSNGGRAPLEVTLVGSTAPFIHVQGYVRDPDGFPVDGARVTVGTRTESRSTSTVEGLFSFTMRRPEDPNVQVTATAEGYGLNSRSAIVQEGDANWVNLTVPLGPDHGNVLGTVRTDGGMPLEGAEVQLTRAGTYRQATTTAQDGSFAFLLVPADGRSYQLSVVAPGYDGVIVDAASEAGRTVWYKLEVREDVTSVETIHGSVRSNEGLPVANAVVRIGSGWNVVTDANGSFVLVDEHLEGHWSVSASLPGFENTYRIVEVVPDAEVRVDLTLAVMEADATTVGGSVLRADGGKPLEGATVRLARSSVGTWTFETTTGPDGAFSFRGVPLAWESVTVTVSHPDHVDHMGRATLSDSSPTLFEVYMQRTVQPAEEEPIITDTEAKQVGAGVTITVGALMAILLTEVGRVALLSLVLVPLYTKIKREKVMDHFVRGRIYEFVCQNPGVNYSAIKEQFKLTNGTVTYHLSMLERQEFIRAKQDGIYKRYFPNNGGPSPSDVEPMSLQLSIARAIRERPGMTQKEIAKRLKSSKQLVSYHIRRMKRDGQIDTRRDGRSVRVYPNHLTPE
jgi:predicted transcriptional regulator/protocatechuate 3,4-dioxygenase beta subunit